MFFYELFANFFGFLLLLLPNAVRISPCEIFTQKGIYNPPARNLIDTDAVVIKSSIVLGDQAAATLLQNGDDLFDDRELDVFSPHKPKKFLNHWM